MRSHFFTGGALAVTALLIAACSGSGPGSGFGDGTDGGTGTGTGTGTGDGGKDPGSLGTGTGTPDGGVVQTCKPDPSYYDIPGDNCDNDGDGKIDNVVTCDTGLSATGSAADFAKALGLCQVAGANDTKWGVISATFQNGHTSTATPGRFAEQHSILPRFGSVVKPREGSALGVISSGAAAEQDTDTDGPLSTTVDPAFKGTKNGMQTSNFVGGQGGDAPPGFPKATPGCGAAGVGVKDVVNVKLQVRVPANAKGLAFDFDFWSGEWPEYVCSDYNDAFIAYLSSKAFNAGKPDNMSFDAKNNPVSVNNGFFDRCTPNTQTGCQAKKPKLATAACPGGIGELAGTGFDDPGTYCKAPSSGGGATGWLTSQAPVQPGEVITLEFMIWDAGDESWDSSVLLDNFQWIPNPVDTGTTRPPPR
jgi:hypothetical protein